jgi:pantetheine-phosphate adenylyltransferase
VLENEEKEPLFTVEKRMAMIHEAVGDDGFCRVESFSGLLVDFLDRAEAKTIVRGLRAVSDFEYEFQMALMNRHLNSRVETVFLMPKEEYSYLSSRLVKEVFRLGGDLRGLVPPRVLAHLSSRFGETGSGSS